MVVIISINVIYIYFHKYDYIDTLYILSKMMVIILWLFIIWLFLRYGRYSSFNISYLILPFGIIM